MNQYNGLETLWKYAQALVDMALMAGNWLTTNISDLLADSSMPSAVVDALNELIALLGIGDVAVGTLIMGTAIGGVLTFKLVKFIVDLVL